MSVRVNVKKDLKGIPVKTRKMTRLGQYALINQVHADMNNYVPNLDTHLRNQSSISLDGRQIIYNVPYAKPQFYGYMTTKKGKKVVFKNYTTPGTGPRWDEKAKPIHKKSWERVTKKAMK